MPLSTNASPSPIVLDLVACSLRTFSHLYFITSTFGTDGFGAYRSVWYGSLDLAARAAPAKVQQIVETLEPSFASELERSQVVDKTVKRSTVTCYLNAVEQLVAVLPDQYLADSVLPIAKAYVWSRPLTCNQLSQLPLRYLVNKRYQDTFEAAHSVLLAIFARRKDIATELAPWYAEYLVEVSLVNSTQFITAEDASPELSFEALARSTALSFLDDDELCFGQG